MSTRVHLLWVALIALLGLGPTGCRPTPPEDSVRRALAQAERVTVVSPVRPSWLESMHAADIPSTATMEFLTPRDTATGAFVLVDGSGGQPSAIAILPPSPVSPSPSVIERPELVAHYVQTVEALRRPATSVRSATSSGGSSGGGPSGFGLRVGMTFDEVRKVRGTPSGETTTGSETFWSYDRVPLGKRAVDSAAASASYKARSMLGVPIVGDVIGGSASESIRSTTSYKALGLNFVNGRLVSWSATTLR